MEQVTFKEKVIDIISISFNSPPEDFENLRSTLSQTPVVGLDAEWKPQKTSKPKTSAVGIDAEGKSDETRQSEFPKVCVLQIACLRKTSNPVVFLLDLWQLQPDSPSIPEIHELLLRDIFKSPNNVKLGFGFKQDFQYISYTFQSHFKYKGFDRVDQYLDIFDIYNKILAKQELPPAKERKKLSEICDDILDCHLSKEYQQSDWSEHSLKKELMEYAAIDAYCLIEILDFYCRKFLSKGLSYYEPKPEPKPKPKPEPELKIITIDELLKIVTDCEGNISGNIVLEESDRQPRSRINNGGQSSAQPISIRPRDFSLGDDGRPKFLCDAMMAGLAGLLSVAGMDTKIADLRDGSITVDLIKQAEVEGRIIITAAKHGTHAIQNYFILNTGLKKEDQLYEVLKYFGLEKIKDQISRCLRCDTWFKFGGTSTPGLCMDCRDPFEKYLEKDEEGVLRLDLTWMEKDGLYH